MTGENNKSSKFNLCSDHGHRGFQLTFANGYTISVQWGTGNYCEARHDQNTKESPNAEVAVWSNRFSRRSAGRICDNWTGFGNDQVCGWLTTDRVATLISAVQALPASRDPSTVEWVCHDGDNRWEPTYPKEKHWYHRVNED
jgi:hypothetical protein